MIKKIDFDYVHNSHLQFVLVFLSARKRKQLRNKHKRRRYLKIWFSAAFLYHFIKKI